MYSRNFLTVPWETRKPGLPNCNLSILVLFDCGTLGKLLNLSESQCFSPMSPLGVMVWIKRWHVLYLCFSDSSVGKESACNAGDLGSITGLGRSPGEGNGYPLQYSGLKNPGILSPWDRKESDTTEQLSLSLSMQSWSSHEQ